MRAATVGVGAKGLGTRLTIRCDAEAACRLYERRNVAEARLSVCQNHNCFIGHRKDEVAVTF